MPKQSTALLAIGPRTIAPWGDRAWRVSATAQLVEATNPYWIVTPTQPAQHQVSPDEIEVSSPHADSVVDSILIMLASHFGGEEVEAQLTETHNLKLRDGGLREISRFYEISDLNRGFLAGQMSQHLRLGLTQLDDLSLVNRVVVDGLRHLGFDVEVFGQNMSAQI